jgi:hypothetical protein
MSSEKRSMKVFPWLTKDPRLDDWTCTACGWFIPNGLPTCSMCLGERVLSERDRQLLDRLEHTGEEVFDREWCGVDTSAIVRE